MIRHVAENRALARLAGIAIFCLVAPWLGLSAFAATNLTAEDILSRAAENARTRAADQTQIAFTQLTVTEELGARGKVKERKEKVLEMVYASGRARGRLVSINGKPPPQSELKKEAEDEAKAREAFGDSEKEGRREDFFNPALIARYTFILKGEETINGRTAYRLDFSPKTEGNSDRKLIDKFLNRIAGSIWVDVAEFEVARADIRLIKELNLLAGILGSLSKLDYSVVRNPVIGGVWVNTSASGDFEGRKLLDSTRVRLRTESADFRRVETP